MLRDALQKLDPHSAYLPADQAGEANEALVGRFEGIGVTFAVMEDTILVLSVEPEGPAERAGLQPGDFLLSVNGRKVSGEKLPDGELHNLIRGRRGTPVELEVARKGYDYVLKINAVRDRIPIYSIDAAFEIAPGIGYIRLSRFSSTSVAEFRRALEKLGGPSLKNLILDLRGNTGGYLETAVEMSSEFLEEGRLITYTEGARQPRREYRANGRGAYLTGRLVVLINQQSASASEILAGAIQDWDRGILVGQRSFGKGLVQRQLTFPDGSLMRLTVARYFTPAGRLIQKPYLDRGEQYRREILTRQDGSGYAPDSLRFVTFLKQRPVYGGGGISPDIPAESDTSRVTGYVGELVRKGILVNYVLRYWRNRRSELLEEFPNPATFMKKFQWTPEDISAVRRLGERQNIPFDEANLKLQQDFVQLSMKATLAQNLWGREGYVTVLSEESPEIREAIRCLERWEQTLRTIGME